MMKFSKLNLLAISILSVSVNVHAETTLKDLAPNQYDCTVDELELYVMKRTENLRKQTTAATWEDFKKVAYEAKSNPTTNASLNESGNAALDAKNSALAASASKSGSAEEEDDCPLFFADLADIEMPDSSGFSLEDLGSLISGGLSSLGDLAKKQMEQLVNNLYDAVKAGVCERLSTEYLTELGTKMLDSKLKEEIGYTTKDINSGNFANQVVNDALKEEYGTSNAKLLNIMDENLNNKRKNFMKRQTNNQLDLVEKSIIE